MSLSLHRLDWGNMFAGSVKPKISMSFQAYVEGTVYLLQALKKSLLRVIPLVCVNLPCSANLYQYLFI